MFVHKSEKVCVILLRWQQYSHAILQLLKMVSVPLNFAFHTVRRTSNHISGEPLKNTAVDKILDPFSAERG